METSQGADDGLLQITHHRWAWAVMIPWIPDASTAGAEYLVEATLASYRSLALAIAGHAPTESAVQFRFLTMGATPGRRGTFVVALVGAAANRRDAGELRSLVLSTLPREVPREAAPRERVGRLLSWLDKDSEVVAIRRNLETARPDPLDHQGADEDDVLLPARWQPDHSRVAAALTKLGDQLGRSCLVLHLEPLRGSDVSVIREHLVDVFQVIRQASHDEPGVAEFEPLLRTMADDVRRRLRLLPLGALRLRVLLGSGAPLSPGAAQGLGAAMTGAWGYQLVRPGLGQERTDAQRAFAEVEIVDWQEHSQRSVASLHHLVDPYEAAEIFRLPEPPRGGLPGISTASLNTLPRSPQLPVRGQHQTVEVGVAPSGGGVELTTAELNQHCLVVGLPGFGKSRTVQGILSQLWRDHGIPFLILDPAKADYGSLISQFGSDAVHVRLGPREAGFNPFAVPDGVEVEAHASRVLAAMDAALQLSSSWPGGHITLGRALFRAYEIADREPVGAPTLRSLYAALGDVLRGMKLGPREADTYRAVLLGRLESLVRGPLGAVLTGGASGGVPWSQLLNRPALVEFRSFAGPTERSLVFGLLLAGLMSYREANPTDASRGPLGHVTVLEEAHRVVSQRGGVESEGARLMAEAIAELRGSGEGFIIVDQAPTALHPVVRKVTGSIVCHRLVDPEERATIGAALLLDARQSEDLARLRPREAVVFGAQRPSAALAVVRPFTGGPVPGTARAWLGDGPADPFHCVECTSMCRFRPAGFEMAERATAAGASIRDVATSRVTAKVPGGAVWCATAHMLAKDERAADPRWLLPRLAEQRQIFEESQRQQQAAARESDRA